MDKIKIGLIGLGNLADKVYLHLLNVMENVDVYAVYDINSDRRNSVANSYNIQHVCESVNEILDFDIDAVIILAPNYLHAKYSVMALNKGKHVLCEKPMAISKEESHKMLVAAQKSNKNLMIGFNNRFRSEILKLKEVVDSGIIGKITEIDCGWIRSDGIPGIGTWFTNYEYSGGGVLSDIGSHIINIVLWISRNRNYTITSSELKYFKSNLKKSSSWYSAKSTKVGEIDVEITAKIEAKINNSIKTIMEYSWYSGIEEDSTYITIKGTEGIAEMKTLFGMNPYVKRPEKPLKLYVEGNSKPIMEFGEKSDLLQSYRSEILYFIDCIYNGNNAKEDLLDAHATTLFVKDAYKKVKWVLMKNSLK